MMTSMSLGTQSMSRLPARAARAAACSVPRPAHSAVRCRVPSVSQRAERRQLVFRAAADEAATAEAPVETEEDVSGEEDVPVEQTSEASPFAELIERARAAMESGEQEDKDQVLADIDTELTVSSAKAAAADAQLAAVQGQADAAQDKYLRLNADFDNFRKRSSKEKADAVDKTKANVITELLPVIDAFEAAAGQVKAESEGEQRIAASYQGLYAKMVDAFKKMGLEVVPGVGTPFDPEVHEAIMRAPSNEVADGTVLQEFRRGFTIGGQLLRPAMVQVSYTDDATAEAAPAVAEAAELAAEAEKGSE